MEQQYGYSWKWPKFCSLYMKVCINITNFIGFFLLIGLSLTDAETACLPLTLSLLLSFPLFLCKTIKRNLKCAMCQHSSLPLSVSLCLSLSLFVSPFVSPLLYVLPVCRLVGAISFFDNPANIYNKCLLINSQWVNRRNLSLSLSVPSNHARSHTHLFCSLSFSLSGSIRFDIQLEIWLVTDIWHSLFPSLSLSLSLIVLLNVKDRGECWKWS